jgi:hypothetical protein
MVSVEGDGREFVGKETVIKKSEAFQGAHNLLRQELRGPFFCGDPEARAGRFTVHTVLEFSPKDGPAKDQPRTQEEVGLYYVEGDQIVREEFFYVGRFI